MGIKIERWQRVVIILGLLLCAYVITRLFNLTILPIFTDEAIYIRWSQIGSQDANWRFISLTDGKQPLFTWVLMVLLRFIKDPLFAGRLVSVIAGAFSVVALWLISFELFRNKKAAYLASVMYLLCPFALMYDRMALYDSLTASLFLWSLYMSLLLVRLVRLDTALILGAVLGLGMLNKSIGFLSLYLLPITFVLFDFRHKDRKRQFLRLISYGLIAAIISQLFYSVLRLSPFFNMIDLKNTVFVYTFREWLMHPFNFVFGNARGLFDWMWHYLTIPILLISLIPLFLFGKDWKKFVFIYVYCLLPFIALALFGKVLYPRFILFMVIPLLIPAGVALDMLFRQFRLSILAIAIYGVVFLPSLYMDYYILTNPTFAPIPFADKGQFTDDWPAGGGVSQVNQFLLEQSKKGKIAVYTEGTFGLLPYAIEIYLVNNPNVYIKGVWPLPADIPGEILASAKDHPTYLVLNQTQIAPIKWPLLLLAEYQKGSRENRKLRLYQVVYRDLKKI